MFETLLEDTELQKDFRWTVRRSNIDIMIHADENKIILMIFFAVWTCHFSAYSREKFSVKVFDVCLKHI